MNTWAYRGGRWGRPCSCLGCMPEGSMRSDNLFYNLLVLSFLLILLDMPVSADNAPAAEQIDDSGMYEEALLAVLAPDQS